MPEHPHSSSSAAAAGLKSGELVELDYELWSESPSGETELIDTTRETTAASAGFKAPEGFAYGARAHRIGGEFFPSGIENALAKAKVGEEFTREFPPAEAFGERDPRLIELFSMHEIQRLPEMRKDDAHLDIGTVLTINGRRGRVVSLTAARVRVDFNPPLSGRKIKGTFKILKAIEEPAEQVRGILDIEYGRGKEFHVEVKSGHITLTVPDRSKFDFTWVAAKPRVIDRLRTQLKPESIKIVEEYVTPPAKEKDGAAKADAGKKGHEGSGKESTPAHEPSHAHSAPSGESKS
jgi:FKBP-type peptidyl-prolyl cis-trans isomerase 2